MEGKSWIQKWGTRHTFITLSFFLMIMNQCWRINLSVAIVAMVNHGEYMIEYGLSSFQVGDTKLERFLPKNQHAQRKLLNF